jgi:hypothetical protein
VVRRFKVQKTTDSHCALATLREHGILKPGSNRAKNAFGVEDRSRTSGFKGKTGQQSRSECQ